MRISRIIKRRIRREGGGVQLDGDVNAVISANVGQRGRRTVVSSRQSAVAGPERSEDSESPAKRAEGDVDERPT